MDVVLGSPAFPFYGGSIEIPGEEPTSGGVLVTVPDTITLDGYTYGVETKSWRFSSQDTFRDAVVAGGEPNDSLFSAKGAWARYKYGWHHGADQEIGDFNEEANPFRFDTSSSIDPWQEYQATLHHSTMNEQAVTSANPLLVRSADYVFCADGPDLYRTSDLETWTAMTDPGGTIQALATDGTDLYVATSTQLVRYLGSNTTATVFATAVTGNVTNVGFVGNRLVAAIANVLVEVAGNGAQTTIETHFQAAFRWTSIFNIGSRIYVGGFAGSRSELYATTTDGSGNLVMANEAAPLPTGELLRTAIGFAGVAVLCTSKGVRLTQLSGDGTLTYGPLITATGDTRCAVADGGSAFVGWSSYPINGGSGVARLELSRFVEALQPAYAADVSVPGIAGAVTGVARLGDRTAFAVATAGVFVEATAAFEQSGRVTSGRIYFGTIEPKRLISLEVAFGALSLGETVDIAVTNQDGQTIGAQTVSATNINRATVDLNGAEVVWCDVRIELTGTGTSTPRLDWWRIRGYPVPPASLQWLVPIINHEVVTINDAQGQDMAQDVAVVGARLANLYVSRKQVTLSIGDASYRVRVEGFESQAAKWTNDGKALQGVFLVQLVST